ncbi:GtrA family protein [Pantoea piersonii]|uniref:GtrA family protein n=1 Tax=Pantoea piersonii TaxID=2364647 RepID=UPI0035E45F55
MKIVSFDKIRSSHLIKFLVVGAVGFFVDGSLLLILKHLGMSLTISRLFSFSIAVSCTWFLNKSWTFNVRDDNSKKNFKRHSLYIIFQCLGAIINFCVFVFLTKKSLIMQSFPLMPFSIASGLAMFFNYLTSKFIVFKSR